MAIFIRYTTQFDEFKLKLESIDDQFEKAIDKREFPGTDGAELDDLGMMGRSVRFSAVFWRDTYDDHRKFLEAAHQADTVHNFVHPAYGLMFGMIRSTSVRHDQRQRIAVIDVMFEEQLQGDFESKLSPLILPQMESKFISAQARQMDLFRARALDLLGTGGSGILSQVLGEGRILSQVSNLSRQARGWVQTFDTFVSTLEGTLATVENPVNSLISTIDFGTDLPGRVIGAVANTVERISESAVALALSPARFFDSFYFGIQNLVDGFTGDTASLARDIVLSAAQFGAVKAAELYDEDEANRDIVRRLESQSAFDITGRYIGLDPIEPVMTVNELESSLATVRTWLQSAITLDREMLELPEMARRLTEFVSLQKIERQRVVEIDVPYDMPLTQLCHGRGLSYRTAERVLALNASLVNPVFSSGVIQIYE